MNVYEMQNEIKRLKKENDVCILAHAYQSHDICEIADYVGDSFGLSVKAAKAENKTVLMCGVRFMAETVKILSPNKRVLLSNEAAGCPMADQIDRELVLQLHEMNPGYAVAAYINTTAETKTAVDVCVTSSSAVKIINNIENENILFLPDCNLGDYIKRSVKGKNIKLFRGGCPTHLRISARDIDAAREKHPGALILIHPECAPDIVVQADFVGSTTEIMDYAKKSACNEFIIGTENSIAEHLKYECTGKRFYALSKDCVCHNMKATTLPDVLACVKNEGGEEIILSEEIIAAARKPIDEMLRLG